METKIRIENFFDFAKVPMGRTPELTINGKHQKSTVSAPLATVEATLVAACSKGVKAFQLCGGVQAEAIREQISRAPVFTLKSTADAMRFSSWIPTQFQELKEIAESTTSHGKLIKIQTHVFVKTVHVEFTYTTGDASGQNMTTFATHKICQSIINNEATVREFNIISYITEGNMSSDKKPALHHIHNTRGVEVTSWGTITKEVCLKLYKIHPRKVYTDYVDILRASMRTGTAGGNINISNIMSAMFIACGQDAASIAESSWGQLSIDIDENDDLHFSLYIPSLLVGTVGGGTMYETQRKCLEMVNCYGSGKKLAFAETVASFCLALELSTLLAILTNTFAESHKKLARL